MEAWLQSIPPFPSGGEALQLEYRRNTRSVRQHAAQFDALLAPLLGAPLFPGSLNLWSTRNLRLPEPAVVLNGLWHLWPVIVAEQAAGVAARRTDVFNPRLLEAFSNVEFVPLLGLEPGARVAIRVLPGQLLPLAG